MRSLGRLNSRENAIHERSVAAQPNQPLFETVANGGIEIVDVSLYGRIKDDRHVVRDAVVIPDNLIARGLGNFSGWGQDV